jgi:cyclin H
VFHKQEAPLLRHNRFHTLAKGLLANMTEDEIYRASTQYRLWSYTEASLASLRAATNSLAATRVKNAIDRLHADKEDGGEASQSESSHREVDCLTVEEEQKLVNFYCIKAMDLSDFCEFPTNVKVG